MRADLYVYSDSFAYNLSDKETEILSKLIEFRDLTQRVVDKDNVFLFNTKEFSATQLLPDGTKCGDLLNMQCPHKKDFSSIFLNILTSGIYKATTFSSKEIDELLGIHDSESCNAKVVLSKTRGVERSKQVLGTYEDWRAFRSYFLGLYPGNVDFFYKECEKYYPNLRFGKRYKANTQEVLISHSEKITECLLNIDIYFTSEFCSSQCSHIDFPQIFARKHNIDGGSFEGTKDEKFKIFFIEKEEALICEPHLKFNSPDASKTKVHNINLYCRIYFYMPTTKTSANIYIGAIVRHL